MGQEIPVPSIWNPNDFIRSVRYAWPQSSRSRQFRLDVAGMRSDREWELIQKSNGLSRAGSAAGNKPKKPSLEEELKALREKIDIDDFEYKSVPRPSQAN